MDYYYVLNPNLNFLLAATTREIVLFYFCLLQGIACARNNDIDRTYLENYIFVSTFRLYRSIKSIAFDDGVKDVSTNRGNGFIE